MKSCARCGSNVPATKIFGIVTASRFIKCCDSCGANIQGARGTFELTTASPEQRGVVVPSDEPLTQERFQSIFDALDQRGLVK